MQKWEEEEFGSKKILILKKIMVKKSKKSFIRKIFCSKHLGFKKKFGFMCIQKIGSNILRCENRVQQHNIQKFFFLVKKAEINQNKQAEAEVVPSSSSVKFKFLKFS